MSRSNPKRRMLTPGPKHPISIGPAAGRVVVSVAGAVVADSDRALILREARHRPAYYVPKEDVAMELLEPTDHTTYCPYKGDASYFSIPAGGERSKDAVWEYQSPRPAVAEITGHVAFYPDRVDAIDVAVEPGG